MPPALAARPPRPRAVPPQFRTTEPNQRRAQETLDRFAEATEALLRERPFEDIPVQDIVRRAGRPIGSFYARFGSKEALLPFLYQRYHARLEPTFSAYFTGKAWERLDFPATASAVVEALLAMYDERRWLLRTLALFARQHPEALPGGLLEHRRGVFDLAAAPLLRHRRHIRHRDPAAAVRFGIFLVCAVAREQLLFPEAPHARTTLLPRPSLHGELTRVLISYLTTGAPR